MIYTRCDRSGGCQPLWGRRGRNGDQGMGTEPIAVLAVISGFATMACIDYGLLIPDVVSYLIRALLASIAVILLAWRIPHFHRQRLSFRPPKYELMQLQEIYARSLQVRAGSSGIDATQAKVFAHAVTQPSSLRQRIVDTYTPGRRAIEQRVSIGVRIPRELIQNLDEKKPEKKPPVDAPIYFPVIIPVKGKLQDGFDLFDSDGSSSCVLGYREYLQLAASVLRLLLLAMCQKQGDGTILTHPYRDAEQAALRQIMKRGLSQSYAGPITETMSKFNIRPTTAAGFQIAHLLGNKDGMSEILADSCRLAVAFVDKLTNHYCIVGSFKADQDGRMLVKYEQAIIPTLIMSDETAKRRIRFVGWLRVALGARPVDLTININNASTCKSYHLRLLCGDELYLGAQEAIDFDENMKVQVAGAPTTPYIRFRERLGQGYAHFYTRFFPEPVAGTAPRIRFVFFEVPPGSMIRSAVTALAAFGLIWVVAAVNSRTPSPDTDAPAFLLAFPAIAAAWLGFESPTRRLLEGTLRSRFCLMVTAVISLAATTLFLVHKSILSDAKSWPQLPWDWSFLWVSDLAWAFLLFAAFTNAAIICYNYSVETWQFAYYATRKQHLSEVIARGY